MVNPMRKLATVETISAIRSHDNADALELATVRGWQVVVRRGEYQPGDKVIYLEIDSWVPNEIAPFLSKGQEPRVYEGVKGERLRTIKLRGELSQGLVLPPETINPSLVVDWADGTDLTEILGVIKWEPPIPAQLAGQVAGLFPSFIRKTDQERVQNCFSEMAFLDNHQHGGIDWYIEEKLDGSSCTVFVHFKRDVAEGLYEVGVCSRNLQLKLNEENANNSFIKTVTDAGYIENLPKLSKSIAVQGELCGPGIQGNPYKLPHLQFFVFDVFLINEHRYATKEERWEILQSLTQLGVKVDQVPHLGTTKIPASVNACLTLAEGKSKLNPKSEREGIVFKTVNVIEGDIRSFKAISNRFLLKEAQ